MKGKQSKDQNVPQNKIQINKKTSIKDTILELNKEFDETINFNHHYTAFRKLSVEKPISQTTLPFLMIREFLFSYFEETIINKEPDKESIAQILGHIKQFSNSHDINYIKNFLTNIKTYAEVIGLKNTSNILVPALAKIVDESYQAKIHFLKSLLPFIDYLCSNGDEGINILKNNMFNIIQELYQQKKDETTNEEMKKLLFRNVVKIAKAILPYDKEQFILNIIIGFGNEDYYRNNIKKNKIDEHKILCIRYIRMLAEGIGKENTEKYLLPQLISFSCEKNDDIKKELLFTLPNVCEIVSFEFFSTKIYDILRRITTDVNHKLRKICVIVIAKIIKIYKNKCKEDMLNNKYNKDSNDTEKNKRKNYSAKNFVDLIEKLTKDKENSVKFTIIEKIGEIISPLDKNELSKEIFDFYKKYVEKLYEEKINQLPLGATKRTSINPLYRKMSSGSMSSSSGGIYKSTEENIDDYDEMINDIENEYNKQITEEELYYYFAYNFPAVLYCYGKQSWSELKKIYFDFCFEEDIKIRLSIIASFHEIANILGKEITENELLPVYDKFLESNEKYEQKLAIKNLPKILYSIDKKKKERYYKYFEPVSIFMDNTGNKVRTFNFINWKNKLNVIEGILCYYNLYDNDIIYNSILPQCITFCFDKFYKVRKTSAKVLATLIVYLYKENYKKDKLFKILENFAFHKKFKIRINFIKMCSVLLVDKDLYNEKIKELLKIIVCKDKILDVKIALSKVLKKIICDEKQILYEDDDIHKICNILSENNVIIKRIFNNAKIKKINEENNNNIIVDDNKNYFIEDDSFFIEEFKIELEKKDNKDNEEKNQENENGANNEENKDNNIKKEEIEKILDKNDEKLSNENKEEKKNEESHEVKNTKKDEKNNDILEDEKNKDGKKEEIKEEEKKDEIKEGEKKEEENKEEKKEEKKEEENKEETNNNDKETKKEDNKEENNGEKTDNK